MEANCVGSAGSRHLHRHCVSRGQPDPETRILQKKNSAGNIKLVLSLSTIEINELRKVAEIIKKSWEKIGVKVNLMVFEKGDLDAKVIEPRLRQMVCF